MFDRFDKGARQVVADAQEIALAFKHNYIGTEHVLIALFNQNGSVACEVLKDCGLDKESTEVVVLRIAGVGSRAIEGMLPLTPEVKKSFEFALRDTLSDGAHLVTPEYLLQGLLREEQGVAAKVVRDLGNGASYEGVKSSIKQMFEKFPSSVDLINAQIQRQIEVRNQANAELRRLRSLLKEADKAQSE